ncbi:hypothetical protein ScPMuIL_007871 [Solemya velum]
MARLSCCLACFLLLSGLAAVSQGSSIDDGLLIVTVATEETDGFRRFMRSAKKYDLDVEVHGLGVKWEGGDVATYPGGGQKVLLLRDGLKDYKLRDDLKIMFVDSYDLVFTNGAKDILERFERLQASIVFSAEGFCWPDESLASSFPTVKSNEKRYLNSGGFIGNAKEVVEMLNHLDIAPADDDQLYYTQIYLDSSLRHQWSIKLDTRSEIFQNLNGALGDVTLKFMGTHSYLYNIKTGVTPVVIHGNGPIKAEFNRLANYLVDGWTANSGCQTCKEDTITLKEVKEDDYPSVLIALFVEVPSPFIAEYFQAVTALNYPKNKIHIFIHNAVKFHEKDVTTFLEAAPESYLSVTTVSPNDNLSEDAARNWAVDECIKKNCNYLMVIDSLVQMTNPDTLKILIEQNRTVLAPMMTRVGKLWSNFWGAINQQGFYARSEDYTDIAENRRIGVWNVPYLTTVYLVHASVLPNLQQAYTSDLFDPDMAICSFLRKQGRFMFVTNRFNFGHLVDNEHFDTKHLHNELYQIFDNPYDWEKRYIHENYSKSLEDGAEISSPCPDVFWFPVYKPIFCQQLIEEMENFGQWSGGKNDDPRLAGGYENVPTVDIHMNQIGMEKHWLHFLSKYVQPLQQKVFLGYISDPPRAIMMFTVRYRPDEQPLLRPHHDSSTYTTNIALNRPEIDFEGGGCRFIRYNCSVLATRQGWMLMHPGRLTHFHEGLRVTKGTRYIMVTFVDP